MGRTRTNVLGSWVIPWAGESWPDAEKALKPKLCRCENPAVVTEVDNYGVERRCIWCGKQPR